MDLFDQQTEVALPLSSAVISECGRYRYRLTRTWDAALDPACFVMLNPSTADATHDDPTIRRCVGFARGWGCGGIVVVNLFAFRATDPAEMFRASLAAIGPENDRHVRDAAEQCRPVVAAWGAHGGFLRRDAAARRLLVDVGSAVLCLGVTKQGHPRHPLYVPAAQPLVPLPYPSEQPGGVPG
jgi:hypothetical protein